ncbi:DUF1549 domain-containing protein [Foetidibacter luteolus]|uniref:DUF1549 domain-containing protein n=1 Tax=Foetidibacter luteolus TaxID=2608880 RepID=UPI00129B8AF0|nr:DUF1549 domain-containing protein [Foetidibacter luteolus]
MPGKNKFAERKKLLVVTAILLACVTGPLLVVHAQSEVAESTPPPASFWLWDFFGRLHPLVVHFPVGLLFFAAILELFTLKNFRAKLRPGINVLVVAGAVSAVVSAVFGLLLARNGDYGKDILAIHQWTGIATALLGVLALVILRRAEKQNNSSLVKAYRGVLFFTALGVSVAGHYGGSLTHGSDYLSETLPWSEGYKPGISSSINFASLKDDTAKLTPNQEAELSMQVKTIFAHNCYKCHGSEKVKGDLRLDVKEMIFKGGEHGPVIVAGNALESEILKRITLPEGDKKAMPSKDKRLSQQEIDIIKLWIQKGAPWPANSEKDVMFRVARLQPRNPPLPKATEGLTNPVDIWVNEYFKKNETDWPELVADRVYLKRIYLDIIGLLPTPEEEKNFTADKRTDKRAQWVRQLLNRNDDYAGHWLTFWNDALRNDYTGTGYITGGRFNISDWLYKSLQSNKPYNQFVQELISPTEESKGFIEGIKWRGVINASQKTEMQAAQNVSQVFLGLNLKCASCHNSFISNWKLSDAYAFATIFADTALEINRCDKPTGKFIKPAMLWSELGNIDSAATTSVKRKQLSENITNPLNGRLYRTLVNRVWAQMMGRGLVEPVDVMDNEPWSQDLLDWMAFNFVEGKCDIKELIYLIATSNTYQLPSVAVKDPNKITAQDFKFKGMLRKRMTAEQFSDAVSEVIEPVFPDSLMGYNPYKEKGKESIKPLFTRAALVINNPFLIALGRPSRETVSTGRESQANLLQALELTKGERLDGALKSGAEKWLKQYQKADVIINELYSRAFNRQPDKKEFEAAKKALGDNPGVAEVQDLFWAVVLLPEFQIIY